MFASAILKLSSLNRIRATAIRQTLGLFAAFCVLILGAVPAMAQTVTASSVTPNTYSGAGVTLTFSFTVNSGSRQVTSASVTSGIGVSYACAIPPGAGTNTNITFTCTGTYVTTAADNVQVLEVATININSAGIPLSIGNNVLIATYVAPPPPTVNLLTPFSGPEAGGTSVTLTGTNFTGVTAVSFGTLPAASFTVNSATSITATSPAGTGSVNVRVTTGAGTSALGSGNVFTYTASTVAPAITTNPVSSTTVNAGSSVSFTAAASGTPTPTVQWQVSTDNGATFNPISGATSATLTFTAVAGDNGKRYRAVFSNSAGSATTTAATLTVQTTPVITLQPVGATVAPGQPITLSTAATGNPTPTVQWSISENGGASWLPISTSLSFTIISPTARTLLARAVFTNAAGTATTDAVTLTWVKQDQTISFTSTAPSAAVVGGATYTVTATASSGLTVNFAIDPSATSVCSVAGSTVSFIGVGTCTINANQAGNTGFNAAPQVQQTFTVGQGANVITFPALSDTQFGSAPPALSATASSGLAVSYASNSTGICTVAGGTISFVSAGTCSITASQAGDANYVAATPVTQTFAVTQAPNAITFPPLVDTPFTSAPPVLSATASSGLAVSYASNSTGVCTVAGGTISFVSAGTCSITASQAGNAIYQAATPVTQTFAVTPGTNTITFPPLTDTPFTSAPPVPGATASSGLAVSYATTTSGVCTVSSGGTISFVSAGTCSITASQAGNGNYEAASPVTQSFTVLPGVNTITFAPLPNRALGSGSFALAGSASSGLTVTFTSATTGVCSVSGTTVSLLAVGTCTINANQAGNASYQAAPQVSQSFEVTRAVTTVGLTSSTNSVFFGMPVTLTATVAGTSPTGTVTFSDGATVLGSAPLAGNVATFTTSTLPAGARQLTATYSGDASNLPATSTALSVAVNARPNPANDPEVQGTVSTQFNTVERFGRTQINNISNRLDQLHGDGEDQDALSITLSQPTARLASTLPWEQGGQQSRSGYGYNTGQPGSASGTLLGSNDPLGLGAVPVQSAAGYAATPGLVEPRVVHVWASGDISFGKQQPNGLVETRFTSSGITVGMDGKATDNLKLGVALGFAWDHSRFGTMGSESDATNASLAFYGSLKAAKKTYVDLIVGTGYGTIDSTRFSTTGGVLLDGKRRQRQVFAALIVTVEAKAGRLEIAPYLRADGIWVHLSPYTETGSPFWALTYQSASENSYSGSAGLRLRYPIDNDGRWLLTGKAEYRHRVSGDYAQLLDYADIQGAQGSPYLVTGQGVSDSTFTGGIGLEARLRTMSLRLNYDLTTMAGGNVANSVSGGIIIKF